MIGLELCGNGCGDDWGGLDEFVGKCCECGKVGGCGKVGKGIMVWMMMMMIVWMMTNSNCSVSIELTDQ